MSGLHLTVSTVAAGTAGSTCPGDCNVDWRVDVDELVQGIGILLGDSGLNRCPSLDVNHDTKVSIDEFVTAIDRSMRGCRETPTATETPTPTSTATATATVPVGPKIVFFGLTLPDDSLRAPTEVGPDEVPVYELPIRFGFSLIVEADRGISGYAVGDSAYEPFGVPDLQVQATSQLGNGSSDVCDDGMKNPGGVPAIQSPSFDYSPAVVDALNDLGCRFINGSGLPTARNCSEQACIQFDSGQFGCESEDAERQFCGVMTASLSFPLGETLVSARVLDSEGNPGPVARLIVRIVRPTPPSGG